MDYIKQEDNTYKIIRNNQCYGVFDNLVSAKTVRDKLIECNFGEDCKYKHITPRKDGKYEISKKRRNTKIYVGVFDDLHQAICERDKWVLCDWDLDLIVELP